MVNKVKKLGQVFTPDYIVDIMLNFCGYTRDYILDKHVIDNSCGDGAFLSKIVTLYIERGLEEKLTTQDIKLGLETYIHGIEIDEVVYTKCINKLNQVCKNYGISEVNWDINNSDTISAYKKYIGIMDYVVGNPPYVRIHNIENATDIKHKFPSYVSSTFDLYILFFKFGIEMLSTKGKLCYISPSSWFSSLTAKPLREELRIRGCLHSIIDFEHHQMFKGVTTYTSITLLDNSKKHRHVNLYYYDKIENNIIQTNSIPYSTIFNKNGLHFSNTKINPNAKRYVQVKNGFATLCDKVFISNEIPQSKHTIDTIKASSGVRTKCFFPYDKNGKIVPWSEIECVPELGDYLLNNKETLIKSDKPLENWYLFGRTQGILDVYKEKLAISNLISEHKPLRVNYGEYGCGVYSGLYIIKLEEEIDFELVKDILQSKDLFE